VADRLGRLIGLRPAPVTSEDAVWAVRRFLEVLADRHPLVVVIDDLHWAQPACSTSSSRSSPWPGRRGCWWSAVARPELLEQRPGWSGGRLNASTMLLEPLAAEESATLLEHLAGEVAVPADATDRITRTAEGNPLFLEELLAMLIEDGRLHRRDGPLGGDRRPGRGQHPPTIQALLAARLGPPGRRRAGPARPGVGDRARPSTGRRCSPSPPSRPAPRPTPSSSPWSARSCCGPPRPPSAAATASSSATSWSATPPTTRCPSRPGRTSTSATPPGWPRPTPAAAARSPRCSAGTWSGPTGFWPSSARSTPAAARVAAAAAAQLAAAGHTATGRGDLPAAANLLERAIALLGPGDRDRLQLLTDLGEVLVLNVETDRPSGSWTRPWPGPSGPATRGWPPTPPSACWSCASTRPTAAPTATGPTSSRRCRSWRTWATSRARPGPGGCSGLDSYLRCQIGRAEDEFLRAVEHARAAGDQRVEAGNLYALVQAAYWGPTPVAEGIRRCTEIRERAEGSYRVEMAALHTLAALLAMAGDVARARELGTDAAQIAGKLGPSRFAAICSQFLGQVELLAGDPTTAERWLRWGAGILERMGERGLRAR
jgi:hypothetical protein